jgi:alkylated DNA nucleotide flippase Atl1
MTDIDERICKAGIYMENALEKGDSKRAEKWENRIYNLKRQEREMIEQDEFNFDGPNIEAEDTKRLGKQLTAVYEVMTDGKWRTLGDIAQEAGYPPESAAGISARLRDLRKDKVHKVLGSRYDVHKKRVEGGIWEYRMEKLGEYICYPEALN